MARFLLQEASGQAFTVTKTGKKLLTTTVAVAVIAVIATVLHRSSSRSALARYKAELRAKGEKLTFKELAGPRSTNADHLAALRILDSGASYGFPPTSTLIPRLVDYISPGKARVGWRDDLRLDGGSLAQSTGDWETLDRQNQTNAPFLDKVRHAMLTPPPDSGWIYDDAYSNAVTGPPRVYLRDRAIGQALMRDEIGALHHGNLDGALADLNALTGFPRMYSNELTLSSQMIRVALAGLALYSTWEALQAPGWDEPRLAALQRDWESVEFMKGLEHAFEAERAYSQSLMAHVRTINDGRFSDIVNPPATPRKPPATLWARLGTLWEDHVEMLSYRLGGSANEDELLQLQHYSRMLDLTRSLEAGRPWPEISAALSNTTAQLLGAFDKDRLHRLKVSAVAIPNFSRAVETTIHNETQRRLTITAIAIKRYELKHGAPPQDLSALTSEFLAKVPIDPMSGRPLCYRLNMDNTFALYSIGDDGKDDGGSAGMTLWSPFDAVWPIAATAAEERAAKMSVTRK